MAVTTGAGVMAVTTEAGVVAGWDVMAVITGAGVNAGWDSEHPQTSLSLSPKILPYMCPFYIAVLIQKFPRKPVSLHFFAKGHLSILYHKLSLRPKKLSSHFFPLPLVKNMPEYERCITCASSLSKPKLNFP